MDLKAAWGYSLVELMVTITIGSILLAIGVPSYRYVTYSNRVSGEVNGLLGDMQFARSEAVKEGQSVTVCPSNSNHTACTGANQWNVGWLVFSDINANQIPASTANILRIQPAFTASTPDSALSSNSLNFVSFNREGFASGFPTGTAGFVTITLHTTPVNAQWTRCLQVFMSGMMGTERTNDPQGNCS